MVIYGKVEKNDYPSRLLLLQLPITDWCVLGQVAKPGRDIWI